MNYVEQYLTFHVDQDWQSHWPKEGSIYIYRGKDYNKDKMRTLVILEKIGEPIEGSTRARPIEIKYA